VEERRLIDVQYGGEVGLVATLLGGEPVTTPKGTVRARRYQIVTPTTPAASPATTVSAGLRP